MKIINIFSTDRRFVFTWAVLSGIIVYIQSCRWVALGDYAYMVEYAYKLFSGSIPFRDFMTPYPPGTFYIMSWLMKIFGMNNLVFKIYVALLQGLFVVISYLILQRINNDRQLNKILVLPLAFVGQAMFPFPEYDEHAQLFVLAMILLLIIIINDESKSPSKLFLLGILIPLPTFFKQNVGVGNIIATHLGLLTLLFVSSKSLRIRDVLIVVSGSALVFTLTLFLLVRNNLLANAFYDIFSFPAVKRNPLKSLYHISLDILSAKFILLYASFFLTIVLTNKMKNRKPLAVNRDSINLALLVSFVGIPLFLLGGLVIKSQVTVAQMDVFSIVSKVYRYYGGLWYLTFLIVCILTFRKIKLSGIKALNHLDVLGLMIILMALFQFLSQRLQSAYSIWPLLLILLIHIKREVAVAFKYDLVPQIKFFIFIVSAVNAFWLFASNAAWYQEHLSFNFKPTRSMTKRLNGLACEGNVIPMMDNMFKFVEKEIPFAESVATIPGEDPFFFATGRKSVMSYLHLIDHTFDYDTDCLWNEMKSKNIVWIIVKIETQVKVYTDTNTLMNRIKNDYILYAQIRGYDIYRRKDH